MTDDIVDFIEAQLAIDEQLALATTPVPVPGRWKAARDKHADDDAPLTLVQGDEADDPGYEGYSYNHQIIVHGADWRDEVEANLRHIARHDPATVLADVVAKRAIIAMHELCEQKNTPSMVARGAPEFYRYCECQSEDGVIHGAWPCDTLKHLAAPYASHPDFKPEWGVR